MLYLGNVPKDYHKTIKIYYGRQVVVLLSLNKVNDLYRDFCSISVYLNDIFNQDDPNVVCRILNG